MGYSGNSFFHFGHSIKDAQQLSACHLLGFPHAQLIDLIMHGLDLVNQLLRCQAGQF